MSRWRDFLRSLSARIDGSFVVPHIEMGTALSTRAEFPADQQLLGRIAEARAKLPEDNVKPLIETLPIG